MATVGSDKIWHPLVQKNGDTSPEYIEYRRRWEQNPRDFVVEDFPIHLDIETITSCNLRCVMCFQEHSPLQRRLMSRELFDEILSELDTYRLDSIKFQFRGEPLLDGRLPEFIKAAKEKHVVEVMINTNAVSLGAALAEELIEAGLDKIICSIDGYTEEVYGKIRVGGDFDRVVSNVRNLAELKREKKSPKPYIMVRTIEMDTIDVQEYRAYWEAIADQVGYADLVTAREEDFTELPDFACPQLWQRLVILADGEILPCCSALDWSDGREIWLSLGNLSDISIHNAWTGAQMNSLRKLHMNGESHKIPICRKCRFCGFRGFN